MGFGGISPMSLIIILAIIILLFGTKKLRSLGGDVGSAIKNFKQSMSEGENESKSEDTSETIINHSVENEKDKHSS